MIAPLKTGAPRLALAPARMAALQPATQPRLAAQPVAAPGQPLAAGPSGTVAR
jgi:hypothetical protein